MDVDMPDVDDIYFYLLFAKSISTLKLCNYSLGTTVYDMHYLLSLVNNYGVCYWFSLYIFEGIPFHRTSPPWTDLEALPEPNLANYDVYI